MPTTPTYALPYPGLSDPPHGPNQVQALANKVETELTRVDSELTRIDGQPIFLAAASTANMDLTTTEVDVTGATVTFNTTKVNARFLCIASFYFAAIGVANSGIASGKLHVDGVVQAGFANFTGDSATPDRMNLAQSWVGTLAAAGSHTLKLRGVGSAATAAQRLNSGSTTITVLVFE
jgi:hypothetical protein